MFSQKAEKIPPFHVMEVLEKAQELERQGNSIIHLEIGEPDFPTAPHICEAAIQTMRAGKTKYTHSLGLPELRLAVAEYYNGKFGLGLTQEQVIITSGTSPALLLLFLGLLEQGDEVVMSNPYYACYPNFVEYLGGKAVHVHTGEENGFSLEPEAVAGAVTRQTKAVLINSPCNPTGHVMNSRKMKELTGICDSVPVISDEIYQGLVYKGQDHSILEFTDNAFVLNGFSKLFAMTGWRLGYLISPPGYIRQLQKLQQNFFICANSFVQHAGVAALRGPMDHVKEMVATYDKRRRYMLRRLKDIGFGIKTEPEGAYYILANAKEFGSDSFLLCRRILEEAGVAVTPGIDFGDGAEGYIRFSYASGQDNIKEGMDRIEKYLNG
ncbi:MAG TPA: pyridoxal phosphate-dependent aminotransferase [candidate division Zixibacteria bacterium]|nr:pyridoxal phosphate-dependent aminotransferase [candidate division Zixibacteria bacterium]